MKELKFEDSIQQEVKLQHSSAVIPSIWMHIKAHKDLNKRDGKLDISLHLRVSQVKMLINSLEDLLNDISDL